MLNETLEKIAAERLKSNIPEDALAMAWAERAEAAGVDEDLILDYVAYILQRTAGHLN